MQAATVDSEIYVFSTRGFSTGLFARFSPTMNAWSALDSIPLRNVVGGFEAIRIGSGIPRANPTAIQTATS